MIPYRLCLTNFLSYRAAVLDFQGLHTACICGANGAGKSSLLEAITWALWGESRVTVEDDVIHLGASEVSVELVFQTQGQFYRVIRSRHRRQATCLEFQLGLPSVVVDAADIIADDRGDDPMPSEFRSLTAKGVRATQHLITQTLNLDYETFISSAYLRQGRADEFMLRRPHERKQVLADLLKLNQYDRLAERAKEQSRQDRAQAIVLEQSLAQLSVQLQDQQPLAVRMESLVLSLEALQAEQERDRDRLEQLNQEEQQRQAWEKQQQLHQQERQHLEAHGCRLLQEQERLQRQQAEQSELLRDADAIVAGYEHWQQLQQEETRFLGLAERHHQLTAEQQQHQRHHEQQQFDLRRRIERLEVQLQGIDQQLNLLQPTLDRAEEIATGLAQFKQARSELQRLNQLEAEVSPLLQRSQQLEAELKQLYTQLAIRLESLQQQQHGLEQQQAWLPQLQTEYEAIKQQVKYLEERRQYRDEVLNKGLERRSFLDQLKAHVLDAEAELMRLEQQRHGLQQAAVPGSDSGSDSGSGHWPLCPCCDRPLAEQDWMTVQAKNAAACQAIIERVTVMTDQMAVTEKEIEVLRQEYRAIGRELRGYAGFLQRQGQLRQQLVDRVEMMQQQQQLQQEIDQLQTQLQEQRFSPQLQEELRQLQTSLAELNYDERDHAIARGEVERWRWTQLKQSDLRQAQRRREQLRQQQAKFQEELEQLRQQNQRLIDEAECWQQQLSQQLDQLQYDVQAHQQLRQQLQQNQAWPLRHQALQQAQTQSRQLLIQGEAIANQLQQQQQALEANAQQLQVIHRNLESLPVAYGSQGMTRLSLEQQMQERRQRLDVALAEQGRLQQQQQQLQQLQQQYQEHQLQLQRCQYQQRIHQELAQAFGKNGIQALMIESLLPQLEQETNQILARLSQNQLHVQFITQKAKQTAKSRGSSVNASKESHRSPQTDLIDTLDIRIADAKGTRPYETYSGGEAFRVNFSIRLALARLMAQRSGTALQLLIVDEGFGTQDGEGCDRLIAAINAIAPDFARILTITHMPQFKEAFQARIEVSKTEIGSTLTIAV